MAAILGVDNGLTVTKAVIFDFQGRQLAVARRKVPQIKPQAHFVERDMDVLWIQTAAAIYEALALSQLNAADITAVSVTAHGDGLYLLDAKKRPLGKGILSLDSRAQSVVSAWDSSGLSLRIAKISGQNPHASAPAALLAWIKDHQPERFGKIAHIISSKDWLRFCLTGEIATDRTEASTSFTDVTTQEYSKDIAVLFGLSDLFATLPEMRHSAEIAGHITAEAAELTSLKKGTPVATGLHDVTASALGIGAHSKGILGVIAGTYSINEVVSYAPKRSHNWLCRNAIEPGQWNNMAISPSSTANYEWFLETFCKAELQHAAAKSSSIHDQLGAEIDAGFARNSSVLFHPYLFGSPFGADASASFMGLRGWHNRSDIIAAILEGIAFNHRHHVQDLQTGFTFQTAHLTGGASRNPHIAQVFADVLGLPVKVARIDEAAAWGAAVCAGKAVGVFGSVIETASEIAADCQTYGPRSEHHARFSARYDIYRDIAKNLRVNWGQLEQLVAQTNAATTL